MPMNDGDDNDKTKSNDNDNGKDDQQDKSSNNDGNNNDNNDKSETNPNDNDPCDYHGQNICDDNGDGDNDNFDCLTQCILESFKIFIFIFSNLCIEEFHVVIVTFFYLIEMKSYMEFVMSELKESHKIGQFRPQFHLNILQVSYSLLFLVF